MSRFLYIFSLIFSILLHSRITVGVLCPKKAFIVQFFGLNKSLKDIKY